MKKRSKRLAHRVLVSLQIELDVGAPDVMSIIKKLTPEHILNGNNKIHDIKFLLVKKQTEPFTQEEIDAAYEKRRQKGIIPSDEN